MNGTLKKAVIGIKEYVLMAIGMSFYAFGWVSCIMPSGGMGGGATGLSMLCNSFFLEISVGTFVFIINATLLLIAGFIIGWKFGIKTIYCIIVLSISMNLWKYIIPNGVVNGEVIADGMLLKLTAGVNANELLLIILGAVLAGIGVVICFSQGGSTGGTDIVAMIINKYRTISYGRIVISSDFFIIGSSIFIADNVADGMAMIIYGYIMVAVFGYTVDLIQSGNQQSSQIFIISKHYEQIADAIINEAHRGATVIDGTGWYTKEESKIVMVVCRKRDASMILKTARKYDSNAFISMGSVMGVYGQGFEALTKI